MAHHSLLHATRRMTWAPAAARLQQRALPLALAAALCVPALSPCIAAAEESVESRHYRQLKALQDAAFRRAATSGSDMAQSTRASAAASPSMRTSDPAAWRTDEFNADWGKRAINADHAYARGLSGSGVRVGVLDSGTGLDHPEFAGKAHTALRVAGLGPDGTRCPDTTLLGAGGCVLTHGDDVSIYYTRVSDAVSGDDREWVLERLSHLGGPGSFPLGHGTHVAGTIAANRDGNGMHGVAFGSTLTVARLTMDVVRNGYRDEGGGLGMTEIGGALVDAAAVDDLFQQMTNAGVRAINHSWGQDQDAVFTAQELDALYSQPGKAEALLPFAQGARQIRAIQVWAAGNYHENNDGPDHAPLADLDPTLPRWLPDIEPYWLSVVNLDRDGVLSVGSHRCGASAQWCITAPGEEIVSAEYGHDSGYIVNVSGETDDAVRMEIAARLPTYVYNESSGTSMAAPHVTGALALLFERYPYLDNAQVRDVLLTTATDLGEPGVDDIYGWGLVDLRKAIEGYGQLRVDTHVVMDRRAGGRKVWEGGAWDDWTNDIGGPGRLTKSGAGWLRLSGDNTFNGATLNAGILELDGINTLTGSLDVSGGSLLLNGQLRDMAFHHGGGHSLVSRTGVLQNTMMTVTGGKVIFDGHQLGGTAHIGAGAAVSGTGRLAGTTNAGTLAPGGEDGGQRGRLSVAGDYVQQSTGALHARLDNAGVSDLLGITGAATLDGVLRLTPVRGARYLGHQYRVLTADGGLVDRFAVQDDSAFSPYLSLQTRYGPNQVDVLVGRGDRLETGAATTNQRAVARAADQQVEDQGVPAALTALWPDTLQPVLDGLSGELHASLASALVERSSDLRTALSMRAQDGASAVWAQVQGGTGALPAGPQRARTRHSSTGLLVGADLRTDGWQSGLALGTARMDLKQVSRSASARSDGRQVGAHVTRHWNHLRVQVGAGFERHRVESDRRVDAVTLQERWHARYTARTRQFFVDTGWQVPMVTGVLEPYLQVARVEVDGGQLQEQGGTAALEGARRKLGATLTTAGIRGAGGLGRDAGRWSWHGDVGIRHAAGDRQPTALLNWAGGDAFMVEGAALERWSMVMQGGLSVRINERSDITADYRAILVRGERDDTVSVAWTTRF